MLKWLFKPKDGTQSAATQEEVVQQFLPPETQLGGSTLIRNGSGTRKRFGISVYEMALYLPGKTKDAAMAVDMPGAKQIRLVALRDISGDTLASAFINGIRKNARAEQQKAYLDHLGQIISIFRTQDSIAEKSTFHMDLLPDEGAFFYINETLKGEPIRVPGFNEAILSIWLGEEPADDNLKQALLTGGA